MKKIPSLKELDIEDGAGTITRWRPEQTNTTLTYAWNWFAYHANQRLQAFNFFLLILAALATGYLSALDKDYCLLQIVIGIAGVMISFAFLALDYRNEQLVSDGRRALRMLERALETEIHRSDYLAPGTRPLGEMLFGIEWPSTLPQWPISIKHSDWLRRIERFALVLFVLAAIAGVVHTYIDYGAGIANHLRAALPARLR